MDEHDPAHDHELSPTDTAMPIDLFLPVRAFTGFTRLSEVLTPHERVRLSREFVSRAAGAGIAAGMSVRVVTSDPDVAAWCREQEIGVLSDPGSGLSDAASFAVTRSSGRWMVMHPDLPLVASEDLARLATGDGIVLVPSLDGGTNLVSGSGPFPFSYGPGSFHRHLAAAPGARVAIERSLMIDLDTVHQLRALRRLMPTLVPR